MATHSLERTKTNYYVWYGENEVLILDQFGFCVSSANLDKIGSQVTNEEKLNDPSLFLVPVNCQKCNAKMVFSPGFIPKNNQEINFYKNLAELSLQQFLKVKEVSTESIDQFISRLIDKRINLASFTQFESEANALGINFEQPRIAILVHLDNFEQRLIEESGRNEDALELIQRIKKEIATSVNGFFTKNNDLIVAYVGAGNFLIFKAIGNGDEDKVRSYLKKAYKTIFGGVSSINGQMTVGFGNPHRYLRGLIDGYQEAKLALTLGKKSSNATIPVYYFADFKELRILAEEDNLKKLLYAEEIIGSLSSPELRKTLETFFENDLNITNAAKHLKIHPNTVRYRIMKIRDVLGLDPQVFEEATTIQIALLTTKYLS